jgi:hypothetical protein
MWSYSELIEQIELLVSDLYHYKKWYESFISYEFERNASLQKQIDIQELKRF